MRPRALRLNLARFQSNFRTEILAPEKFCGTFSAQITRNLPRRSIPMRVTAVADLFRSIQGSMSCGREHPGAISHDSEPKFLAPEKFCEKISVRKSDQITRNHPRRSIPMLGKGVNFTVKDPCRSIGGSASCVNEQFGAISHDFGPKLWRPKNFAKKFRLKSRAIAHAAAFPCTYKV